MFVFLAECLVLDQSAVCYLPLHEDLSVIEGDEWFRGLNGQDHDMQVSVQGRLKEHSQFWIEDLKPSSFVRDIVTLGYRLPFLRYPDNVVKANHNSAIEHSEFVQEAIAELLRAGCVVECMSCPHVCSPLHVAVNAAGKKRLVVDFHYINQFLQVQKFKYEGLELVPQMFCKGDFFFTFDLKSGYHHVSVHEDCWPFLGFSWGMGAHKKFFTFCVLPFGLATACYVFTKLMRPLVKRWRGKGIRNIMYIDDGICAATTVAECIANRDIVIQDLAKAGFVLNTKKSCLDPVQYGRWLGFMLDLKGGSFQVPNDRVLKLNSAIAAIPDSGRVRVHSLASIAGQIISMSLAVGPVARLRTRALYSVINQRFSWNDSLYLTPDVREELRFWQTQIPFLKGQPIWFEPGVTRVIYSDASSAG